MTTEKADANIVRVKFPGDMEYIPSIRRFVSNLLLGQSFTAKCAFRSEIIIDEICNNAVTHGCRSSQDHIELSCILHDDRVEFEVKDSGGTSEDVGRLKSVVEKSEQVHADDFPASRSGLGLEIVRMLSEEIDLQIEDNNLTSIRIVRRREKVPKQSSAR